MRCQTAYLEGVVLGMTDEYCMGDALPTWLDAETLAWLNLQPGDRVTNRGTFKAPWHPGWRWSFRARTSLSLLTKPQT